MPTCASIRRSTSRPASSRARSSACRSSTRPARSIGVTQVLNKRGGPFTDEDESAPEGVHGADRDRAGERQALRRRPDMKNYNEASCRACRTASSPSTRTAVVTCNAAGARILRARGGGRSCTPGRGVLRRRNAWVLEKMQRVEDEERRHRRHGRRADVGGETTSVNVTVMPLTCGDEGKHLGSMLMIEDISNEKRVKSTMSRYMDPASPTSCSAGARRCSAAAQSRDRPVLRHPQLHDALRGARRRRAPSPCSTSTSTLMVDCISERGRACSTSSSATRSWPPSALPLAARRRRGPRGARGDRDDPRAAPLERRARAPTATRPSTWASA